MNYSFLRSKIVLLLALLLPCLVLGQTQLSLSQAIEVGLKNNFQIQIAQKELDVSRNNNSWKNAGRYPNINFNLGVNNSFAGQNNPASFLQKFNSLSTGLTANVDVAYTLFDGFRVKINKQRFEALELQNQGNAKLAIENSVQSIILAYYQVLIQKQALGTLEELLVLSKDRIAYQATRQEFGQAGRFDLLQSEDAYFNDSTNYLINLNSYDLAMRNLNLSMGEDDLAKTYDLTDELSFNAQAYAFADLKDKMLNSNQNLKNLYLGLSLVGIEKEAAESTKYPVIRLNGGLNYGATLSGINVIEAPPTFTVDSPTLNSNYSLYVNLSATYNLYNGGITKRNRENAAIQEQIAQLNIENLKRNLSAQLSNTLATYNSQRTLLILTRDRVNNARENLSIAEERFRSAQINSFDYRTIQLNYLNAVQSQLQAVFNLKNTETELTRLTGGLLR